MNIFSMWKKAEDLPERETRATSQNELKVPLDMQVSVNCIIGGYTIPVYFNQDGTKDIRIDDMPDRFNDPAGFERVFDAIMNRGKEFRFVF